MAHSGAVVIVAAETDRLAQAMRERLEARHISVGAYEPHELSDVKVLLDAEQFLVEEERVSGIVWRVVPASLFSAGFEPNDESFADAETVSVWLSALRAPYVRAINSYSATVWYGGCQWPAWRNLLHQEGVSVSPIRFGCPISVEHLHWMPFALCAFHDVPDLLVAKAMGIATSGATPALTSLLVDGEVWGSNTSPTSQAAADVLNANGICLAKIILDEHDNVLFVDTMPDFEEPEVLGLTDHLVETLCTSAY